MHSRTPWFPLALISFAGPFALLAQSKKVSNKVKCGIAASRGLLALILGRRKDWSDISPCPPRLQILFCKKRTSTRLKLRCPTLTGALVALYGSDGPDLEQYDSANHDSQKQAHKWNQEPKLHLWMIFGSLPTELSWVHSQYFGPNYHNAWCEENTNLGRPWKVEPNDI